MLILENRLGGVEGLLGGLPDGVPVYIATREVLDRIAGFDMHRGVLAIGTRGEPRDAQALISQAGQASTIVVCIGISNHDNMGAIFRNAAAFGADAVLIDRTCCDPLYRKAIRVSVGAALQVPFATFDEPSGLVDRLSSADFQQIALSPRGTMDIRDLRRQPRVAIYLGAEGPGLPAALMTRLDTARITLAAGFDSLNVAAASAVALHQLSKGY